MLNKFTERNKPFQGFKNSTDIMNSFAVIIVSLLYYYLNMLSEEKKQVTFAKSELSKKHF